MTDQPDLSSSPTGADVLDERIEAGWRALARRPPAVVGWQPGDVLRGSWRRRRTRRALGAAVVVVALAAGGSALALHGGADGRATPLAAPPPGEHVAARLSGARQLVADSTPLGKPDAAAVGPVVAAEQRLTVALLRELGTGGGNTSVSPLSLYAALGMLQNGADGATAAQISTALQADGLNGAQQNAGLSALSAELAQAAKRNSITFDSANSLWQQVGFPVRPQFLQTLAAYYSTGVWQADFAGHTAQAVAALDRWTSEHTHGKITKLFDSLDPSTVLVLANALYFHAKWATPFDPDGTEPMAFTTGAGRHVTAKFMTGGAGLQTAVTPEYDAIQLPYQGGRYAALAIMPKGVSLAGFTAELTAPELQSIAASVGSGPAEVKLPRFTTTSTNNLKPTLEALGMRDAFGSASDFSALTTQAVSVDQVIQRVYLAVGEKGTTAAAATGVSIVASSGQVTPTLVVFDHPFLFLVRDTQTGAILFGAEIQDPTAAS